VSDNVSMLRSLTNTFILLLFFGNSSLADSFCEINMWVKDEYLVRTYNSSTLLKKLDSNFSIRQISKIRKSTKTDLIKIVADENVIQALKEDPSIASVEPNCYFKPFAFPNDPNVEKNFAFNLIRMPQAWGILTDSNIVVAVPDLGVDLNHEDLQDNLWKNKAEQNGQLGVDDDKNGYVDDVNGWGFPENNSDVTPGNYDGSGHGTHVAGIIGASGNNSIGTSGVAWRVKIMPIRIFRKNVDLATTEDIIKAIYYAVDNGAKVINCSWGAEQKPSQAEKDAYSYADSKGVFVVAAGGNFSQDVSLYTPASINSVFAVGSINSMLQLSTFSSYGLKIALLAPGGDEKSNFGFGIDEEIYSTTIGGYGYRKGTSVSAPFVSGIAALIKTLLPNISPAELGRLLKEGGDKIVVKAAGKEYFYSKLNAEKTLSIAQSVSITQPNCSTNCSFSAGELNNQTIPPAPVKFGGGCSLQMQQTKNASASWDFLFLISFFIPQLIQKFKARK
jgi:subtilisin family serine protease